MTSPILVKSLSTSQILMAQIYPLKMVMFHSYSRYIYLVGGLESWNFAWLSHNNWECLHPNWRTHIFRRVWSHQPDKYSLFHCHIWKLYPLVMTNSSLLKMAI
jgi:hypothetical protein